MSYLLIGLFTTGFMVDRVPLNRGPHKISYVYQTFICGTISAGFGIGAFINNNLSNKYYAQYKMDKYVGRAEEDWTRVVRHSETRDLCLVCAGLFLIPTVYFEVKHLANRNKLSAALLPDFRYCDNRMYFLLKKTF
jgi:hypothetical protein